MSLPETYKAVYNSSIPGGNHQLKEFPIPKPGKNQVLVKMEYAPINPSDIFTIQNNFYAPGSEPIQVGNEGSGIVIALGEDLEFPFKVGDRVHVMWGTWTQYRLTETDKVFHIQGDLSLEDAASHFVNPFTVHYMGALAKKGGHKVAIHTAASSALGRILIKYFKYLGIKLINIVRREEYVEELQKEGADYVLNSSSPGFEQKLKEIAEKENATVAFDAIAGDFPEIILKAMPKESIVYIYGLLSSPEIKITVKSLLGLRALIGLELRDYFEALNKKNEYRKVFEEVHSLLGTVLGSKVQKIFKFDYLDNALEYYNQNSSKGKVLIKLN